VVALSASQNETKEHYAEAGFSGFLNKPYTSEALVKLINTLFPQTTPLAAETETSLKFSLLTSFAGDDPLASANILRTFYEETLKNMQQLQKALAENDRGLAARLSHKLIPLFTMLEAHTLVQQLRVLETDETQLAEADWKQMLADVILRVKDAIDQLPTVE
jgi:HPt (histidine-containing phosphotransfer) domain-containing protein